MEEEDLDAMVQLYVRYVCLLPRHLGISARPSWGACQLHLAAMLRSEEAVAVTIDSH